MLANQLFVGFTIISIIYLLLLQYTKFFSYPLYLAKVSLNLNFYFTIVYIICFLVSLFFLALDWYTSILVEVILETSPYSPYTLTSPENIPRIVVDENGKLITKLDSNEDLPKSSVVHSPVEATPTTKWWQVLTKIQHKFEDEITVKLEDALKKPCCIAGHPEMLKAGLEGISSGKQNPLFTGPYTPEQLGIADLNNNDTSVPLFQKIIVDSKTGTSETYECTNMRKTVDVYTDMFEHVNGTPRFNKIESFGIDRSLRTTGWDQTLCVKVHPNVEQLLTEQSVKSSEESVKSFEDGNYSPKNLSLFDASN